MTSWLYILRCSDGSYYTGTTRNGLQIREAEHNAGVHGSYTFSRRPVYLVFSESFDDVCDAIGAERQIKGWSRAKKEALIYGDFDKIKLLSKRHGTHGSRRATSSRSSP
jgi:putative endonuclease